MNELAIWKIMIKQRNLSLGSVLAVLFLITVVLVGCSPTSNLPPEVGKGSSRAEVISALGEPDQIQDLKLPNEPFFGPQESLINLVLAGTVVEEWVYEIGDDVLYVWFAGEIDQLREDWLVLGTARYPKDAVY